MDPLADFAAFQAARRAYVTGPVGNIALVGYQQVDEDETDIDGWPGQVRRVADEDGVRITASAADGVRVDGELIDGERFVGRLRGDGHPLLTWGQQTIDVFSLDGHSDFELRRYDAAAEQLANFEGIEYYPYDPALVLTATIRPSESDHVAWDYTRASDSGHEKQVPGLLALRIGGRDVELLAFTDHGSLVLTYADATTGAESYAPGRFLKIDLPRVGEDVVVDFNKTIIPPCGFSDFYSCPLPPQQNKLTDIPIRAGEKRVLWRVPRH